MKNVLKTQYLGNKRKGAVLSLMMNCFKNNLIFHAVEIATAILKNMIMK